MDSGGPVTLVVRHRVKRGREAAFEDWLRGIARIALLGRGSGYHVVRPTPPDNQYTVLLRFDSLAALEAWEASDERAEWLGRLAPLTERPPERERHTGLEVWFTPPAGRPAPPRWKMAVVTLLTIYPLILAVQAVVMPHLAELPLPLRTLATSVVLVPTMTWVAMPLSTRVFKRWLYGPAD